MMGPMMASTWCCREYPKGLLALLVVTQHLEGSTFQEACNPSILPFFRGSQVECGAIAGLLNRR